MGVAGCGKTTIGRQLAAALGHTFVDADDYHPDANVSKMRRGQPLDDEDRAEWLRRLQRVIHRHEHSDEPLVLACSALKARHRRALSATATPATFVHLIVTPGVARDRIAARSGHYMPASLVDSQFAALEPPERAVCVDANRPIDAVLSDILRHLQ